MSDTLRLSRPDADILVPDGTPAARALARTTHLCVAAHQDDIEIMAHSGIAECLDKPGLHFTGVVASDGAGSPRTGAYAGMTDQAMQAVRREEQRRAATLGRYNLQIQLAHPSADIKRSDHAGLRSDLDAIFGAAKPEVVYLHNPADSHDTHVALAVRCMKAIRRLPAARQPARVLGCEVWRGLDWLSPEDKVALDCSAKPDLARALLKSFDSQIAGGKRYDEATLGRRRANATFHASHSVDTADAVTWAVDLTPLVNDKELDPATFTVELIERFRADVVARIRRFL